MARQSYVYNVHCLLAHGIDDRGDRGDRVVVRMSVCVCVLS